ncbi:MAG: beta-propeller domain-containing protein [Campylobacterales bacterium]|nr:beta-propeller domain-containing protein [Campylobacterales bacterium]
MPFIWLLVTALVTSLYASATLNLQQGWQLVGIPSGLSSMQPLDRSEVELVWAYDAATQTWQGFSPDPSLATAITQAGAQTLGSVLPYQALWIKSKQAWNHTVDTAEATDEPQNHLLKLKAGWNLVSLPQRSVVSPELFGDAIVWKYADGWEAYGAGSVEFPAIEAISASEGFWVKSPDERSVDLAQESAKLHPFEDEASMLAYIRSMIEREKHYYGYMDIRPVSDVLPPPPGEVSGGSESSSDTAVNATTTNAQEAGVDESDWLKHDGTHIFYADQSNQRIIVTSFAKIAAGDYKPIQTIDLESGQKLYGMYLRDQKLILITGSQNYYILEGDLAGGAIMPPPQNDVSTFHLDILDLSNLSQINTIASHTLEGNFEQSRMIDDRLYLISRFSPQIVYGYPKIYQNAACSELEQAMGQLSCVTYTTGLYNCSESLLPRNAASSASSSSSGTLLPGSGDNCYYDIPVIDEACQAQYDALWTSYAEQGCTAYYHTDANGSRYMYDYTQPYVVSEKLTPSRTSDATVVPLIEPQRFYAPYKLDQRADITTVSAFDITSGAFDEAVSFLGNPHTYYASTENLYLLSSEYPLYYSFDTYVEQLSIYKIALGETLEYRAKGSVRGGVLNQFSMSEHEGVLRIATTTGNSWSPTGTQNSVFALQEKDEELQNMGVLDGLGKKGEQIYAVRFIGDRGFVVTFRNTDPLYTIDLSDPANPRKVGELEIPGYSTYFHPISQDQLLSIGRDADASGSVGGLQIQLFDLSDFAHPTLSDKLLIGDRNTYSDAEYDHKAFIYRASDQSFGFPYRSYDGYKEPIEHFGIYRVEGDRIKALKLLSEENASWSYGDTRGMIFDMSDLSYGVMFKGEHILSDTIE